MYKQDKYEESLIIFDSLVNENFFPEKDYNYLGRFYYLKGNCERMLDKYKEAIADFTKSIENIKFKKSDYKSKTWKSNKNSINFYDLFVSGGLVYMNGRKSNAYLYRAECKIQLSDFYGAINDLRVYHDLTTDSNQYSNSMYGFCSDNLGKEQLAIKYYTKSIYYYKKKGNHNDYDDIYSQSFFLRGKLYLRRKDKQKGCLDLSKAGELGYTEAYEYIEKYCH